MTSEIKKNATIDVYSINESIDEMAFVIGSEANCGNAIEVAEIFSTIYKIKCFLYGEQINKEELLDDITDIVYYIGCEINVDNVSTLSCFINTLYRASSLIREK